MGYYTIAGGTGTVTSSFKSAAYIQTGGRRDKVTEIVIGQSANPNSTDTQVNWDVSRITAVGSSTSFTPTLWDTADVAATATGQVNASTEPTTTASSTLLQFPINQRNTIRWVAVQESQMLIVPTTTSAGVTVRQLSSTYAASTEATISFME